MPTGKRLIGPRLCRHPWKLVRSLSSFESRCILCGAVNAFVTSVRGRSMSCRRVWMRPGDPRLKNHEAIPQALLENAREAVSR
jgi:uncharacterized CHY-type Zn-finger protein